MILKFVKKFIKLIKITNCVCVAVYATVVKLLLCALSVYRRLCALVGEKSNAKFGIEFM